MTDVYRKRPAEIVRSPAATLVDIPRPVGEVVIRGRTKKETLARVEKLSKRGYVLGASPIAQFHARAGGGFGVKIALAKPLPAPMPGWAKGCALVGATLSGLSLAAAVLVNALASLVGAAVALPWAMIAGGAVAFLVIVLVVKRVLGGGGITVSQKVTIR